MTGLWVTAFCRTFGFKKEADNISLNQLISGITTKDGKVLDKGTGLSRDSVTRMVRSLESKGIIVRIRRQSAEKGYEATTYALNFLAVYGNGHQGDDGTRSDGGTPFTPWSENRTREGVEIGLALVRESDQQQTVLQETEEQYDVVVKQLEKFGISGKSAKALAQNFPEEYITDKLALAQWLVDQESPLVRKNPAGWLKTAIEERVP